VSLTTPESFWQLQEALHAKAKREPAARFHSLYDKIYRRDVLPMPGSAAVQTAVRRVWIPKPGSAKKRPLGVPCIKDRVVQMAAVLILEPIFEADLPEEQFGYR
jgi:hypothetical protein